MENVDDANSRIIENSFTVPFFFVVASFHLKSFIIMLEVLLLYVTQAPAKIKSVIAAFVMRELLSGRLNAITICANKCKSFIVSDFLRFSSILRVNIYI